jgi:hypothetical protein
MADDERHLLRRAERRGDDQIALALAVIIVSDDDEFALGKRLQNFLDSIGHFSNISLFAASALAGLNGLRQRQYAGRNGAAGLTEALLQRTGMAIGIDEVRHQSPWSSHKNKKPALRKRHDA